MKNTFIGISIVLFSIITLTTCTKTDPYFGDNLWGHGKVLKDGTWYDIYVTGNRSTENNDFIHYLDIQLRVKKYVIGGIDVNNLNLNKGRINLDSRIRNENRIIMNKDSSTAVYYSLVDDSGISGVFDLLEDHMDNHITFEKERNSDSYRVHFNMAFIRDQWSRPSGADRVEHRDTLLLPSGMFSMTIR